MRTPDETSIIDAPAHTGMALRALAGTRILVVDDEPDCRDALAAVLSSAGAEVRTAGGGVEALLVLPRWWPSLIVSDLVMAAGDGFCFISGVRSLPDGDAVPAVVVSGAGGPSDRERTRAAGFDAHLTKPVDPDELIAVLCALSQRRRQIM